MRYMCSTGRWPVALSSLATSSRELVGTGADTLDGREAFDAAIRDAVERLDIALGQIERLLESHLLEVFGAFVAVRPGMVPNPAAGRGAHAGLRDRFDRRFEPHAAGFDEAGGARPDHLRHQALGVPVLVLLGDRGHVGVAPE